MEIYYAENGTGWLTSGLKGVNDSSTRYAGPNIGPYATWTPNIVNSGEYEVFIYKVVFEANSDPNAKITITHSGGVETKFLDYTKGASGWVSIGTYTILK